MNELIKVENLHTYFFLDEGTIRAVNGVDLTIGEGETVAIVGESGCGKSVTALSILRLVSSPGKIVSGKITLHTNEREIILTDLDDDGSEIRRIRGKEIAMIFQEPMTSLSPVHKVGSQIMEAIRLHSDRSKAEAREMTIEIMRRVGIPNAPVRFKQYPHEMSGGLRQRAMIAMALSLNPSLLIADEPTTALDVTIQAQILQLMRDLQREIGMAILLITHDLGVVAEMADRVAVMYLGRIVETASVEELFDNPAHPYTQALLASIPGRGNTRGTKLKVIAGSVPDPFQVITGCPFHPRCEEFQAGLCDTGEPPELSELAENHFVACFVRSSKIRPERF